MYLSKSIPSNRGTASYSGSLSLFQTASFPMATPKEFAPISAPHNHAGLLKMVSYVTSACGISM